MKFNYILTALFFLFLTVFLASPAFSAKQQFTPLIIISEEYTDNFNQSKNNKDDEFSTRYQVGLSFGVVDKQNSFFIAYNPNYIDYMDKNENDSLNHSVSLDAVLQTSQNTILSFSDSFDKSLSRTVRTNSFEQHDTNTGTAAFRYQFGKNNFFNLSYTYAFDNYDTPNIDEFETHRPSAYMMYWFTPKFGLDLNASYSKTAYEISFNDLETLQGDLRFIKKINPHLDAYVKYAHTFTEQTLGDYVIYNPSIGFDWTPTEDSGVSMGAGVLIQKWDNQNSEDSEDLFFELDVYKNFDFSRKGSLSITGSSGYESISEDAASLGFNIYYDAGFLWSYRLTRQVTAEVDGSYRIDQYDQQGIDRQDNTLGVGAGLVWSPLQWLTLNLSYSFTDFNTDAAIREDYQENIGLFTINMTPPRPAMFNSSTPRVTLENRLFE